MAFEAPTPDLEIARRIATRRDVIVSFLAAWIMDEGVTDTTQSHPNDFAKLLYESTELVEATRWSDTTGKIVVRFKVLPEYANVFQSLAGGAHATAHDYGTGWALLTVAKPGFWLSLGVSIKLNLTFLRPARVGEILLLESEVRTPVREHI